MGATLATSGRLCANRFEIEKAAGTGGMGTVYRAHDLQDGRVVALKLLHSSGPEGNARFVREAQILSELRHTGIVAHVAHGQTEEGELFLAMEWLEGEDLGKRLLRGPLSIHDSITLLEQVADALSLAHQRGVIHRDLKPTNLFLCGNDVKHVKILDFGIARRTTAPIAMTLDGMVVGTPQYMAPEQARAAPHITPAADMFTLGCVLYECLTGQPPFVAAQVAALLSRILFEDPAPIELRRPGVTPTLANLINQLLHKDPTRRPSDASALREALAHIERVPEAMRHLDATLPEPIKKPENFAEHEQRLFSIVLANPPPHEGLNPYAQAMDATQLSNVERQSLLDSLCRIGTAPDFLANGSLIVTVPSASTAQDQATRAARAALIIKDQWPSAIISLATGRGMLQGRNAVGEVVERAAHALTPVPQSPSALANSGIHIDTLSAKLLEGRFIITPRSNGATLHDEEREVDASRPLLGKPTPCVGREAELNNLEGLLGACIEENEAKAIIVTADPGVGKSRLRHEFLRRVEKRDEAMTVLVGRGNLLHAGVAYRMVARAIHALCDIAGAETVAEQRKRLQCRIERHLPTSVKNRVVPLLGEICGIHFSEDEFPVVRDLHQHTNSLPEQLRWAVLTWLGAECKAAPVVFVLDDLHWGDSLTVGVIDEALHILREAPFIVLALARPEVHSVFPSLWKKHRPETMALRSLSKRACTRLVEQALGKAIGPKTVEWIVEQSGGNALFLEELIRAAVDGHSNEQPETVVAMLQARIGHLDTRIRHALLAASIWGSTFWDLGVAAVLGLPDQIRDVHRWLDNAVDHELIEARPSSRFVGQREFAFRHALIHDAAYGLLSEHDRALGHLRAAEHFESKGVGQFSRALLGYHYHKAGHFDRALREYCEAGDAAANLVLHDEAVVHYQHAEAVLQRLPDIPTRHREHADLLLKQIQCSLTAAPPAVIWQRIAQVRELLDALERAEKSEPRDRIRRAYLDYEAAKLHTYFDQYAEAGACLERVISIAEAFHDHHLISLARGMYGKKYFLEGNVLHAVELLEPLLASSDKPSKMDLDTARTFTYLALALAQNGRGRAAESYLANVRAWIDEHSDLSYSKYLYSNIAAAYLCVHDFEQALECARRCVDREAKGNESVVAYIAMDVMVWVHSYRGELDLAQSNRQSALELRARHGSNLQKELFEAVHAGILLQLGQGEAALDLATTAARSARARGSLLALINAERIWGMTLAAMGANDDEVDAHMGASLTLATEVGNVLEAMQTELAWGNIYLARYEAAKARENFLRVRQQLTESMLPCTHEYYMPIIERSLMRCEALECDCGG